MSEAINRVPPTPRQRAWLLWHFIVSHYPLTLSGTLTLAAAAGALRVLGYGSMDLVVFALCLCTLIIVVCSLFATVIGGLFIQRRLLRALDPDTAEGRLDLEAGYPNDAHFAVPALGWLPLVRLEWTVITPDGVSTKIQPRRIGSSACLIESLTPALRGSGAQITRRFEVCDALRLCRYRWTVNTPRAFRILPNIGAYRPLSLQRALVTEDGLPDSIGKPEGDRMEIRPYAPGDSVRDILWKGYARSRQLSVRLPERSVAYDDKTCAYLVSGGGDEAAAALARMALESGLFGDDWRFGADGMAPLGMATTERESALDAIAGSRLAHGESADQSRWGLDSFLTTQQARHCLVFAGTEDPRVIERLVASASSATCRITLILGVEGLTETRPTKRWQRVLWRAQESTTPTQLAQRLTGLSQSVESLVIVDRHSGRDLTAALMAPQRKGL